MNNTTYIVQRCYDECFTDIVLVTSDKEKAYSFSKKFQEIFPDDEIWVLNWKDGVMPYNYELELRMHNDDCD